MSQNVRRAGAGTAAALTRAVRRLLALQHPTGCWTDFLLSPGTSTSWVTGYTGSALALAAGCPRLPVPVRAAAALAADRAVAWLVVAQDAGGGWGYRRGIRPDADSTAWALRLIALRGAASSEIRDRALGFLATHATTGGGYRTYADPTVAGRWADPSPDVTAAVLLARHAAEALPDDERATAAADLAATAAAGRWHSQWWVHDGYPTAVVAEALGMAGFPAPVRLLAPAPGASPWELATAVWTAARTGHRDEAAAWAQRLIDAQGAGGDWPGAAGLVAPPARPGLPAERSIDARGVFTTTTAVQALLAVCRLPDRPAVAPRARRSRPVPRPAHPYDRHVVDMALAGGVEPAASVRLFRTLTAHSLAPGVGWPSDQLSELAGGAPVEFSVTATPGLRLTAEIGDPRLPPHRRLTDGLDAIRRTAAAAGLRRDWSAAEPALRTLADPRLPVPVENRFWLWAGLDTTSAGRTTLKAYVSLLAETLPGWPDRLAAFLEALAAPTGSQVRHATALLGRHAWGHEAGVGAGRGGWGAKVYYELDGFRPDLVRAVLRTAGLPSDDLAGLTPEVPGVLRASLAGKSRAGIAIRAVPGTGEVTEVTVAATFPTPVVGRAAVADRVQHWLDQRESGVPHAAAVRVLLPGGPADEQSSTNRLHSLFTLSRSARGDEVKVYLRPVGRNSPHLVSI